MRQDLISYFKSDTITFEAAMADLKGGSAKARLAAASALGDVTASDEREAAAAALVEVLGSSAPLSLRGAAARSLGELGRAEAIEPLGAAMDADEPALRQVAAVSLGRLGLSDGFDLLATALTEAPPDVRFQAARSLVEIDPERAFGPLSAAIASEDDDEVLGAIALGLGELGNTEASDAIAAHLASTRPETRFEVAYSLALLGDQRGVETLATATHEREHAWDAIEGLELAGGTDAANALAEVITRPRVAPELVLRSAGALLSLDSGHTSAPDARAALLGGLSAWKHHLRGLAVGELGRVGGAWAISELERLRDRRRGAILADEIADALAAIAERR